MFNIANLLKFRPAHIDFQQAMKEDVTQIKSYCDVFMFADKANNLHKSLLEEQQLLFNNITKSYQKFMEYLEKAINMEARHISKKLQLDNRIEGHAKTPAFISSKDHEPNFQAYLPCRLINPSKIDIAKIQRINKNFRSKLQFSQ